MCIRDRSSCGNQTQTESGTDTETTETTGTAEAEQTAENDPATLDELPTDNKDYQDYTLSLIHISSRTHTVGFWAVRVKLPL